MEKLKELFKNKKFLIIFTGFIALIAAIILLRRKPLESQENNRIKRLEDIENNLNNSIKNLKLIKRKNEELERNSHGKSIAGKNSKRQSVQTDEPGKEKGKTAEDTQLESSDSGADDSDDSEIT